MRTPAFAGIWIMSAADWSASKRVGEMPILRVAPRGSGQRGSSRRRCAAGWPSPRGHLPAFRDGGRTRTRIQIRNVLNTSSVVGCWGLPPIDYQI